MGMWTIQTLIKDLRVKANVKFVTRIGDGSTKRTRPIKVVLQSAHQRSGHSKFDKSQRKQSLRRNKCYRGFHFVREKPYQRVVEKSSRKKYQTVG